MSTESSSSLTSMQIAFIKDGKYLKSEEHAHMYNKIQKDKERKQARKDKRQTREENNVTRFRARVPQFKRIA